MIKKVIVCALALALCLGIFASCKPKEPDISSSKPVSSETTESEPTQSLVSSNTQTQAKLNVTMPSFIASDKNRDIFYCAASGGIYKQIFESNKLSKIYSNSGYTFTSVEVIDDVKICVGYQKDLYISSYIIFDLKEKTVTNAVNDPLFLNNNIYSLVHIQDSTYFLSNPDRYGRYTLYCETDKKANVVATGVNEFTVSGDFIYYNIGNEIYSHNLNGRETALVFRAQTNDLLGFNVVGDYIFYMTSTNTYFARLSTQTSQSFAVNLKAYSAVSDGETVFLNGVDGGIYSFDLATATLKHLSDYTASSLSVNQGYLYLTPANAEEYESVNAEFLIKGGIYRFSIMQLLGKEDVQAQASSSSDLSLGSSSQDSPAPPQDLPLSPEFFGK